MLARELREKVREETSITVTYTQMDQAFGRKRTRGETELGVNLDEAKLALAQVPELRSLFVHEDQAAAAVAGLHGVAGFGNQERAADLALELDVPLEQIMAYAGVTTPPDADMLLDGAAIRAAHKAGGLVSPAEPSSGALLPANARAARMVPTHRVRTSAEDRALRGEIFDAVQLLVLSFPYRPDPDTIRRAGNGYVIPTLLEPERTFMLEPSQYAPIANDPTASFPMITPYQVADLVAKLSQLSFVPKVCQNCGEAEGFNPLLESKFWLLVEGNAQTGMLFHLPGMKNPTRRMFEKAGFDTSPLQELKFRKVHDECGIIAFEMQKLVASAQFLNANWFDPDTRKRFVVALGEALKARIYEIKEKTRNRVSNDDIRRKAGLIAENIFTQMDQAAADRQELSRRSRRGE